MDTGLDENEAELGVLVLAVALEVLADGDSLGRKLAKIQYNDVTAQGASGSLTFLMSMYRSSGSSGARPIISLSVNTVQRHVMLFVSSQRDQTQKSISIMTSSVMLSSYKVSYRRP